MRKNTAGLSSSKYRADGSRQLPTVQTDKDKRKARRHSQPSQFDFLMPSYRLEEDPYRLAPIR